MDSSYILSTINPVVGLLLTLTFFLIWKRHPDKKYILSWAFGFLAGSLGYALEFVHFFVANFHFSNGVNILLPVSMMFMARGLCQRYGREAPDRLLLSAAILSGFIGFVMSFGDHNALIRGMLVSSGVAVMMFIAMDAVFRSSNRETIDRYILAMVFFLTILMLARPLLSFFVEGVQRTGSIELNSFWVVSLKVGGLFGWMTFAILFLLRIANDLINELNEQTVTDALSGILNRRGFFATAGELVTRATPKLPISVFLVDIDHFKQVNDTYGHQIGDQVIRNVARTMRENAPETAVIGRLGGEEFAMIMPMADRRASLAYAEALRISIEQQDHSGISGGNRVTVSIGFAEGTGGSLEEVLHQADIALYKAKNSGRNRVGTIGAEALGGRSMRTPGRLVRSVR